MSRALWMIALTGLGLGLFLRRRRPAPLGIAMRAQPRRGKRTGTIELPEAEIDALVEDLIEGTFEPCAGDQIKPPRRAVAPRRLRANYGAGEDVPLTVEIEPDHEVSDVHVSGDIVTEVAKRRDGRVEITSQKVVLRPQAEVCTTKETWTSTMATVLHHELTHAIDPRLEITALRRAQEERGDYSNNVDDLEDPVKLAAYFNSEVELAAHMAEARYELAKYDPQGRSPAQFALWSSAYRRARPFLTPKNTRRFHRMVARLYDDAAGRERE